MTLDEFTQKRIDGEGRGLGVMVYDIMPNRVTYSYKGKEYQMHGGKAEIVREGEMVYVRHCERDS